MINYIKRGKKIFAHKLSGLIYRAFDLKQKGDNMRLGHGKQWSDMPRSEVLVRVLSLLLQDVLVTLQHTFFTEMSHRLVR